MRPELDEPDRRRQLGLLIRRHELWDEERLRLGDLGVEPAERDLVLDAIGMVQQSLLRKLAELLRPEDGILAHGIRGFYKANGAVVVATIRPARERTCP
jgi:hypothetical protein